QVPALPTGRHTISSIARLITRWFTCTVVATGPLCAACAAEPESGVTGRADRARWSPHSTAVARKTTVITRDHEASNTSATLHMVELRTSGRRVAAAAQAVRQQHERRARECRE